jgi:hypothetical protein
MHFAGQIKADLVDCRFDDEQREIDYGSENPAYHGAYPDM